MSKVRVSSWRDLRERFGKETPEGWILPIHLCTGQLEPKVRTAKSDPPTKYSTGAHIIPTMIVDPIVENKDDIEQD